MSRSGYSEGWDFDSWTYIRWRGAVASALRGKRGQLFLMEMLAALDAMPIKRLITHDLVAPDLIPISHWGMQEVESVCAIGAVGKRRGVDMYELDPEDYHSVAGEFGIATVMAQEIEWINDDCGNYEETPEERYARVRRWVVRQLGVVQ
jgi:hypothetical protein